MRHWPLTDLSITTSRLELRYPSLEDLDELGDRAAEGVHDDGFMPFAVPWTDAEPEDRARATLQYQFRQWGGFSPAGWSIDFVVVFEGQVVGTQAIEATDFPVRREVATGSWLGRRFQGKGLGTEMRTAVLHLAFEGLGAEQAITAAFVDNPASLAVTRKLGYREDGVQLDNRQGKAVTTQRFRLLRDDWHRTPGIEIHNLQRCLPLFGLTS
ncbi:GNAT family N-acetyltransferase [Nonomuraea sp. NPDC050536]|uniref:GNAT family N-acetyltransferase n=1 Tax=Nonomuraea sp. NPDC050536 TaxID=3364366 RepID=UPI0037C61B31